MASGEVMDLTTLHDCARKVARQQEGQETSITREKKRGQRNGVGCVRGTQFSWRQSRQTTGCGSRMPFMPRGRHRGYRQGLCFFLPAAPPTSVDRGDAVPNAWTGPQDAGSISIVTRPLSLGLYRAFFSQQTNIKVLVPRCTHSNEES